MISVGKYPARVGEYRVQIAWVDLEDEEPKWETMSTVYVDAPKYLEQKLRRMGLNSVTKRALKQKYGMNLMREYLFRWLGCSFHGRTKYTCDGFYFHGHCLTNEVRVVVHDCRSN